MRYLTLIFCSLLLAATAQAQFQRGDSFVDLGFGFNTDNELYTEGLYRRYNASLGFNYFLSEKFAIGLSTGYSYVDPPFQLDIHIFSLGPSVSCYHSVSPRFGWWVELASSVDFGRNATSSSEVIFALASSSQAEIFAFNLGFRPGLYYFVGDRFAIRGSLGWLGYYSSRWETNNELTLVNGTISRLQSSQERSGISAELSSRIGAALSVSYFFRRAEQ